MRIEEHFGEWIVCGHIFKASEIVPGSRWQGSTGNVVVVESVDEVKWVTYSWVEQGEVKTNEKDWFSFQCRYCLIVEKRL